MRIEFKSTTPPGGDFFGAKAYAWKFNNLCKWLYKIFICFSKIATNQKLTLYFQVYTSALMFYRDSRLCLGWTINLKIRLKLEIWLWEFKVRKVPWTMNGQCQKRGVLWFEPVQTGSNKDHNVLSTWGHHITYCAYLYIKSHLIFLLLPPQFLRVDLSYGYFRFCICRTPPLKGVATRDSSTNLRLPVPMRD